MEVMQRLEGLLTTMASLAELDAAVAAARTEMRRRMVGPYRDSAARANEVSAWVRQAHAALQTRLDRQQAELDAEYVWVCFVVSYKNFCKLWFWLCLSLCCASDVCRML